MASAPLSVADPDPARRDRARARHGVAVAADLGALLATVDAGIVDIVAPPRGHRALIGAALRIDGQGGLWRRDFGSRDWRALPLADRADADSFGGCVEALNRHIGAGLCASAPPENRAAACPAVLRATKAAYALAAEGRKIVLAGQPSREGR